jgi:membrane-associated protein
VDYLKQLLDFLLHLDRYLSEFIHSYGTFTYLILFAIIFIETGIVIMPFLPGDSLLFAAGSFAALGDLNLAALLALLGIAAVIGDGLNYWIGKKFGRSVIEMKWRNKPLVKKEHIEKTEAFYEKYGVKTIVIARFVPIVRTLAPFVAGISNMNYKQFLSYNIIGGALWVLSLTLAGYFFGQIPVIKNNFEIVVFSIIGVSLIPVIVGLLKSKK